MPLILLVSALALLSGSRLAASLYQSGGRSLNLDSYISTSGGGSISPERSKLELVQVLFRDGERAPSFGESYLGDPYSTSTYSPWGRGNLTDLGRYRARRLGRALRRQYYRELFNAGPFRPKHLYAYSLNRWSNVLSTKLLVDSFYRVAERRKPSSFLKIHRTPEEIDVLMNSRFCSRYRFEFEKLKKSPEVQKQINRFDGLYKYLREVGIVFDESSPDETLYKLYNTLESQRHLNLSLPDWYPKGVRDLLGELALLHLNLQSRTEKLKRLNGGPLVRRFLESMQHFDGSSTKLHLYSGKAGHLAAFANAHNKRIPGVSSYGSAIILEKRRDPSDSVDYVRILVWLGMPEKIFPISLKGCEEMCPLEEYQRIVQNVLPNDSEMQCLFKDLNDRQFDRVIAV